MLNHIEIIHIMALHKMNTLGNFIHRFYPVVVEYFFHTMCPSVECPTASTARFSVVSLLISSIKFPWWRTWENCMQELYYQMLNNNAHGNIVIPFTSETKISWMQLDAMTVEVS